MMIDHFEVRDLRRLADQLARLQSYFTTSDFGATTRKHAKNLYSHGFACVHLQYARAGEPRLLHSFNVSGGTARPVTSWRCDSILTARDPEIRNYR